MMKKFSKLLLVVLVMLGLQACATGADVGQQGTGTANVATGDVDVGIDQSFTVTFSAAVDPDTVTTDSFFVVPVSDPEPTLIKLAIFEAGVCDPDHAIDATVTCATNTECTLTPTGVLDPAAEYAICLTPAIRFADENMYGYFDGLTETFVTEASPAEPEPAPDATYTVGGTMTGVLNPAVLQNNDGDDLTVEEDGAFVFATQLEDGASYSVTVATPPGEMNCTIENGTGTIAGANVTNVVITCVDMEVTDIPVMEPAGGAYDAVQEVTITSTTEGATIYYTADGSYPSTSSTVYTGPVEIGEGETVLKAIVRKAGMVGNVAASETYVITLEEPEAVKKIFVTDATYNGNLGGVAGADALCEADANKPATGTYKALIVDGVARVACTTANCGGGAGENIDWVLDPSTEYYQVDGTTLIGTTNAAGIFEFPLTNSIGEASAEFVWTGLDNNWIPMNRADIDDCSHWTTSGVMPAGAIGNSEATSNITIMTGGAACAIAANLYCVEQTPEPDIIAAGYNFNDDWVSPGGYWLNGEWTALPDLFPTHESGVYASAEHNGSIYFGGYSIEEGGDRIPGLWVDGVWESYEMMADVIYGCFVYTVSFLDDDVYGGGICFGAGFVSFPGYWLNGTWNALPKLDDARGSVVSKMTISDGQVYLAGYSKNADNHRIPGYWLDGVWEGLPSLDVTKTANVDDIVVSDGSVYAGGFSTNADDVIIPGYWLDGVWTALPQIDEESSGRVLDVIFHDDVFYAGGWVMDPANDDAETPGYWVDGVWTALPKIDDAKNCGVNDIQFYHDSVYASGFCANEDGFMVPGYWRDGEWTALPQRSAETDAQALTILIVEPDED